MKHFLYSSAIGLAAFILPTAAFAGVAGLSSAGPGAGCEFDTIQAAVEAAGPYDTVWIRSGTVTPSSTIYIDKPLTLRGGNGDCSGTDYPNRSTILGGGHSDSLVFITDTNSVSIMDVNLVNGSSPNHGGNLVVYGSFFVSLLQMDISGGSATSFGGGNVYLKGSSVGMAKVDVTTGSAPYGGGVYAYESDIVLKETRLEDNVATFDGGGLYLEGKNTVSAVEIRHDSAEVIDNVAGGRGGGVFATGSFDINEPSGSAYDWVLQGNEAGTTGGAMHLAPDSALNSPKVAHIDARFNLAQTDGGGIFVDECPGCTAELLLEDSHVTDNDATRGAGIGVAAGAAGVVAIDETRIERNVATNEGGGLLVLSGDVTLQSHGGSMGVNYLPTMVAENSAAVRGGGIFNYGDLSLRRVVVTDNDAAGPDEVGNFGTLSAENVLVLGDGGMSLRTYAGGFSDYHHLTLNGNAGNGTIMRWDPGSDGIVSASIVLGGRVREFKSGALDAPCTLFTNAPTGSYNAPDSCHGTGCDPNFVPWTWQTDHHPAPTSIAVDACGAHSSTAVDATGGPRDASPDMGAFE